MKKQIEKTEEEEEEPQLRSLNRQHSFHLKIKKAIQNLVIMRQNYKLYGW